MTKNGKDGTLSRKKNEGRCGIRGARGAVWLFVPKPSGESGARETLQGQRGEVPQATVKTAVNWNLTGSQV